MIEKWKNGSSSILKFFNPSILYYYGCKISNFIAYHKNFHSKKSPLTHTDASAATISLF